MRTELNGASTSENAEELGKLYDAEYYRTGCGPVPYQRTEPQWGPFFGAVAENLIRAFHPRRVLDAGCALGFLVEAFWDRGVEAWGIDVSPYAISQVRRDMQPYCTLGSLAEGIPDSFDLITCIEVLEHMPEDQGLRAIAHMTKATGAILFSSTPYDLDEPTHFNVRPLVYWLKAFRDHGFSPDLDFDAGFVCSHAMMLQRSEHPFSDEVLRLYANFLHGRHEIILRDGRIGSLQTESAALAASAERVRVLEQELAAQAELQEQLRNELALAATEIELLAGLPPAAPEVAQPPNSLPQDEVLESIASQIRSTGVSLKAMEFRLGSMEQQNAHLAAGLANVLDSRIWRTLVRGAGAVQKLFRL
jgi:SAM-dependent methyltransferase